MDKVKPDHPSLEFPRKDPPRASHGPYWIRAHRDWRFWIAVVMMTVAMAICVASQDLAWRPGIHAQLKVPQR